MAWADLRKGSRSYVQRRFYALCNGYRIPNCPEMDEPDHRGQVIEVLVLGLESDVMSQQTIDKEIDLARHQCHIGIHRHPAIADSLKEQSTVYLERGFDRNGALLDISRSSRSISMDNTPFETIPSAWMIS